MKNQKKATFLAICTILCWSTIASAFKIALSYTSFTFVLLYAAFTSFLFLTIYLIISGKLKQVFSCSIRGYLYSALMGFLNPFLYYLILLKAYSLLPAQEALTLNYMWLVMLVLLSIPLLKQKISLLSFLAILVSYFGVVVIATRGDVAALNFTNLDGALLAMLTTVIWALFWILNMKDKRDELVKLFLCFFFGFIFILAYILCTEPFIIPEWRGITASAYVGMFEMGLPFVLWLRALQLSETTARISNLVFITPFLALILVYFILGEELYTSTFVGLILILGGILLQKIFSPKLQS
ncbi:MAG: DMT family transporter [Bacteroidota bacterium]